MPSKTDLSHGILITLGYFFSGQLSLLLAVPTDYAMPIWPPAGIALASVLIWGYRFWPCIFIGSFLFLINLQTNFLINPGFKPFTSIFIPLIVASGATLQAVVAAFFTKRFAHFPNSLSNEQKVISFLFFGGMVGSLINASISLWLMLITEQITFSRAFNHWITWWTGDTIGVFIFTPLILAWKMPPFVIWQTRRSVITLTLLTAFFLTFAIQLYATYWEKKRLQLVFDQYSNLISIRVNQTLDGYIAILNALKSFHNASELITQQEFREFVTPYLAHFKPIQAISWNPLIFNDVRESFESETQNSNLPEFQITEMTTEGKLIRAAERESYLVVRYIEPYSDNKNALGYDVYSEPIRRKAFEHSRDSGKLVITNRINLVQMQKEQASVLLIIPIYKHRFLPKSIDKRRKSLEGHMVAVFIIEQFMQSIMKGLQNEGVAYQLLDESASAKETLLYQTQSFSKFEDLSRKKNESLNNEFYFQRKIPIYWGGRNWSLNILVNSSFFEGHRSESTWLILLIGLILTGFVSTMALITSGRDDLFKRLLKKRTTELQESEKLLSQSQKIAHIGSWCWNLTDNHLVWSEEVFRIFGIKSNPSPLSYHDFFDRLHPDEKANINQLCQSLLQKNSRDFECEHRIIRQNSGETRHVYQKAILEYDEKGNITHCFGNIHDITEHKIAESALKQAASVFKFAKEGILITNPNGIILDVNQAFCTLSGYSRDEMIGQNPSILSSGKHNNSFFANMWRNIHLSGEWSGEIWNRRKNGELYVGILTISAVYNDYGKIERCVALFADISELKKQQKQLEYIAHYDSLTDLPNRVLLADRIQNAINQVQRSKEQIAVIYLDLDGFKAVNDNYGHHAGDNLLVTITKRVQHILREGDTLARIGGDEFVLLLVSIKQISTCHSLLNRVLETIAKPVAIDDHVVQVSASLGVTFYPQNDPINPNHLIRQADQAMYVAKQKGKNNFHFFDPESDSNIRETHYYIAQIQHALINEEFVLYYQPKINFKTGKVIGVEALIRWQCPEQGLKLPNAFLPLLDKHPLSIEIDEWVINNALSQVILWKDQGLNLPVSINICSFQLEQPHFLDKLNIVFDRHSDINPNTLELEIHEIGPSHNTEFISHIITTCEHLGIVFSLDNFGTGYSSLISLKKLPVKNIKIDKHFVADSLNNSENKKILAGIIELIQGFDLEVLAEGVESLEHARMLLQLGCYLGQGYGIARPMPAKDVPDWISKWESNPPLITK